MNANTLPTDTMPLTSTASGQLDLRRFLGPFAGMNREHRFPYSADSVLIPSTSQSSHLLEKMAEEISEDTDSAMYPVDLLQFIEKNIALFDRGAFGTFGGALFRDFANSSRPFFAEVAQIANDLVNSGFHQNAKRILELWEMDYSEEGEKPVSFASIKGFSRFVNKVKFLGEPALGVFNEGTLGATWKTPREQSLLIEFLDADRALFALIRPDPKKPGETIQRTADNLSHDELMKKLVQNGVEKWQV